MVRCQNCACVLTTRRETKVLHFNITQSTKYQSLSIFFLLHAQWQVGFLQFGSPKDVESVNYPKRHELFKRKKTVFNGLRMKFNAINSETEVIALKQVIYPEVRGDPFPTMCRCQWQLVLFIYSLTLPFPHPLPLPSNGWEGLKAF